jgi:hypothetical protein
LIFGPYNYYFYKIMLCNNNNNNNNYYYYYYYYSLIIYIEISMGIFILYMNIIRSFSCFDYTNFKSSLVIKLMNFNGIQNMAHLTMVVISMWMWLLLKFSTYNTFIASSLKKLIFLNEKIQIDHMVSKHSLNYVKLHDSIYLQLSLYIYIHNFWNLVVFFNTWIHYTCFHKYTPISHFIKWNEIIIFLILFVGYIQTSHAKILRKSFKSLKWDRHKHAHL